MVKFEMWWLSKRRIPKLAISKVVGLSSAVSRARLDTAGSKGRS